MTRAFDHAVEVRDHKGEVVRKLSQAGPNKLSSPAAIAIDGKGHLFVAEDDRALVFDPEGAFLGGFETGSGIDDLATDATGALYVLGNPA